MFLSVLGFIMCALMIITPIVIFLALLVPVLQVFISNETVEGKILETKMKPMIDSDGEVHQVFYPVFEYYIDGERYEKTSYSGNSIAVYNPGDTVLISYNKKYPQDAFLYDDKKDKAKGGIFSIVVFVIIMIYFIYSLFFK